MTSPAPKLAPQPPAEGEQRGAPGAGYSLLWAALARLPWNALVLVPCEAGQSTTGVAAALAELGQRLRSTPVTALTADRLDCAAAGQLASRLASACAGQGRAVAAAGKVIASIPPVVSEPLGVPAALAADTVVLCVEVGKTRVASVRRTVALIGRERIAGCFLLNEPRDP